MEESGLAHGRRRRCRMVIYSKFFEKHRDIEAQTGLPARAALKFAKKKPRKLDKR